MNDILKIALIHPKAIAPTYATAGAAGMDLSACLEDGETILLEPFKRVAVPTGVVLELAQGWEAQIRPRSGLSSKFGITVINAPGTVDCDFVGEIKVLLINLGQHSYEIEHGDRVAQMVLAQAPQISYRIVAKDEIKTTQRGSSGFGSTGV